MNIAVVKVELSGGLQDMGGLEPFRRAHVLVRFQGAPLCRFEVPVSCGVITAAEIWARTCQGNPTSGPGRQVLNALARKYFWNTQEDLPPRLPPCSILICTRNRATDLRRCLEALSPMVGTDVEVIVVDNDPSDDEASRVAAEFPVRYFRQERRGVNWARARGARLARNELLLYVDDDVVVDRNWVTEIRKPFLDEQVGAVTGAVEPLELSTHGQYLHEVFSSFYRGFGPRIYNVLNASPTSAGRVGAGANMGVRRDLALRYRIFEAELDGGTAAKSGGDVYALYKILRAGFTIVYAPAALAWHRHRKTVDDLERMLYGYSVGGYCVLFRALTRDRDPDALLIGARWFIEYHLRELWRSLARQPGSRPLRLILLEIQGALQAPVAFWYCSRNERALGGLPEDSVLQTS